MEYISGEQKFLTCLFDSLNDKNIEYCVLRNYEQLPITTGKSDLDILVSKKDVTDFYNLLQNALDKCNGKIIIKYGRLAPRVCILGNVNLSNYGLQLDVHEGIFPYKVCNMFSVNYVLERSYLYNNIRVANEDDANLIAFFKEILHNNKASISYFEAAKLVWVSNNSNYKKILTPIYNDNLVNQIDKLFNNNYSKVEIEKLSKRLSKSLTKSLLSKFKILKNYLSKLFRFFDPPGFTIAILGTDGAGKTTVINKIKDPLYKSVHKQLFYEHMRPNFIPNIAQLLGKPASNSPTTEPHGSKPSGFIGSLFRILYYLIDYTFGFFIKIYPRLVKSSSVFIFDRYYYDYIIDQKRSRLKLPNFLISFFKLFIPKPNIILCLGADPEKIFKRKPELPFKEIELQVSKLKSFCKNNKNAFWVDTGISIDESATKALELIKENISFVK